jgi:glyoxylase-like metal-dependent hydrolase (beta-lactamase superfamily II)
MPGEIRDVHHGLWVWRTRHPDYDGAADWEPLVASTVAECGGEVAVFDPLAPGDDQPEVWARLDAKPPTLIVVAKPDHVRDVDLFVRRYDAPAYGPFLFWRGDVPDTELQPIEPGTELPGGMLALHDGRNKMETPIWVPERRTIVCADALTAPGGGELRVWGTPWHEERTLPALRKWLELPFERIIVSHGEPVHDRAAFERALERDPWQ